MLRKLMVIILASVILCSIFFSTILAVTFEKLTPTRIPSDQIFPSSPTFVLGDKGFCLIQSDNDTVAYYYGDFQPGDGWVLYMDPAKCGVQNPYPFKMTDVHFYLHDFGCTWPVEIQISMLDLKGGNKCNGPGDVLCSQIFTMPSDSAYPNLIHLDLDAFCCANSPFFLEIKYTGGTATLYPSLLMTGEEDAPDTCDAWFLWNEDGIYYEWYDSWTPPIPGYPIIRATGYTQIMECDPCLYWKPDRPDQNHPAPSGMPDFGQYQFVSPDSAGLCGPAAVANCLWWFDAVPSNITDPADFIRLLSNYFHTDPNAGTFVDSIQAGLDQYFNDYGFPLYEHTYSMPQFGEMEDSLKKSQDIILLLGLWQPSRDGRQWYRFGGHFVTLAGVCSESLWVALSDPARDRAEDGWTGRVRPAAHPPHTDGDTLHNDPEYVSHDIFLVLPQSPSPGGFWSLPDYYLIERALPQFEGQNFQPGQQMYYQPYTPGPPVYAEVEYAIMICPTGWYWKPDRPDQDHPAPSGMPDFDQNQDEWNAYCGPVAVANCLWWFDAVPERWNPPELIDTLAKRFHTKPDTGTYVDSMQLALDQYFKDYGFGLQESTFVMPDFFEMEDSLKKCQDIILLLGFWWYDGELWHREGGHFVTMSGVCSESLQIAISDPDWDGAVGGWPGRVRPPDHPGSGTYPPTLHNDPTYVSHERYNSILQPSFPSPGNPYWEIDYPLGRGKYSGINVPKEFIAMTKPAPKDDVVVWHTEVEYAVMICPKPTAVEEEEGESGITPKDFQLYQSYPNPFNSETNIKYDLLKSCEVSLTIYNILGQKVKTLANERQEAGSKTIGWDGKDEKGKNLASGIYFYQLKAGDLIQTKRMVLLK